MGRQWRISLAGLLGFGCVGCVAPASVAHPAVLTTDASLSPCFAFRLQVRRSARCRGSRALASWLVCQRLGGVGAGFVPWTASDGRLERLVVC